MKGKSYLQKSTQERGSHGSDIREIKYCHNLIAQVHPNPNEDVEYKNTHAMLIARCMDDINNRVMTHGASFAQQFLLHKGLKVFGEHGHEGNQGNGLTTLMKLFRANISQGYDFNRKEKGDGSTDVPNREERQVS